MVLEYCVVRVVCFFRVHFTSVSSIFFVTEVSDELELVLDPVVLRCFLLRVSPKLSQYKSHIFPFTEPSLHEKTHLYTTLARLSTVSPTAISHSVSAKRFTMACFSIREARQQDIEDVFRLVKEFAEYEKKADQVMITAEDFKRDWDNHLFHVFVAELKTEGNDVGRRPLVGYVLYYYTYNSWYGRTCVMDDFYVADEWRRKGMGCALFSALMQRALDEGCAFVSWNVLKWNKLGIDFYLRRGARDIREEEGRTEFCMTKEAMKRVVAEYPPHV